MEERLNRAFKSVANIFDVLSHPDRLKILSVLDDYCLSLVIIAFFVIIYRQKKGANR